MFLDGKVALVTGGAQGIGLAVVKQLLQNGACVSICDIREDIGEEVANKLSKNFSNKIIFLCCDNSDEKILEDCFKRTVETFGGLDIVANVAGIVGEREDTWRRVVDVNLKGSINGSRLGMKYMSKESGGRGGTVVNIASITAFEANPSVPIYSATKAAINQFTRSFGHELYYKKSGVRLIGLNPGYTVTALSTTAVKSFLPDNPDVKEYAAKRLAGRKSQSPDDVAKAVLDLIKVGQIGSVWSVDGGELKLSRFE